jgi:hypothetical protein
MFIQPFAALSETIPSAAMQAMPWHGRPGRGGTLFDIVHGRQRQYFFDNWRRSKGDGRSEQRRVASIVVQMPW